MEAQPMKLGEPVYVVVRVSRYLTNVAFGNIVTWDETTVCYSNSGLTYFADRTLCYPNVTAAENRKREIERETQ